MAMGCPQSHAGLNATDFGLNDFDHYLVKGRTHFSTDFVFYQNPGSLQIVDSDEARMA